MASKVKVMIFPDIRISDLKRDVEEKRKNLDASTETLVHTAQKKTKPLVFIQEHPKLILGTLFGFLTSSKLLFKLGFGLVKKKKGSIIWRILKAGWAWKIFRLGASLLVKKNLPKLETIGNDLLKAFLKAKK